MLPSGLGNLRMLLSCTGMGLLSTVLYVWVPAMLVNFFVLIRGVVMVAVLAGAFIAFTVSLYLWGTIETQRDRELACAFSHRGTVGRKTQTLPSSTTSVATTSPSRPYSSS
jgi:TM2 domain-containing membrane protein YozV